MTSLGLPIPQGFIVTTEACREYYNSGKHVPEGLLGEVDEAVLAVEALAGKKFGDVDNPLLLSVRSICRLTVPDSRRLGLRDCGTSCTSSRVSLMCLAASARCQLRPVGS